MSQWDYRIRAYSRAPHRLVMETVHRGTASRDVEIAAFTARMRRGEIAYIDVIAQVEPYDTRRMYAAPQEAER